MILRHSGLHRVVLVGLRNVGGAVGGLTAAAAAAPRPRLPARRATRRCVYPSCNESYHAPTIDQLNSLLLTLKFLDTPYFVEALNPLLACAALVVEGDDALGRAAHVRHDEANTGIKLSGMPLDLGDHPARLRPASGLLGA